MTNIKSVFGAGAWAAVASFMMLAALEPVSLAPAPSDLAAAATNGTARG
jgi:hypothetical protein